MEGYHPWNFHPPVFSELGSADFWGLYFADSGISTSHENRMVQSYLETDVQSDNNQPDETPTPGPPEGPSGSAPGEQPTEGSMSAPPRPPRKPKSKTLRPEDWAPLKDRVLQLLKDHSLAEVRQSIHAEFGFDAT